MRKIKWKRLGGDEFLGVDERFKFHVEKLNQAHFKLVVMNEKEEIIESLDCLSMEEAKKEAMDYSF